MSKFKVGDKVVRLVGGNSEKFVDLQGVKDYYTITNTSRQGYWLQVDGVHNKEYQLPWYWANFELYQEPEDDELPPVPDSVMYFNSVRDKDNDQRLVVEMTSDSDEWSDEANAHVGIVVVPRTGSTRASKGIGINLTPDAALQLASDLRRMAMEIKRKEKA